MPKKYPTALLPLCPEALLYAHIAQFFEHSADAILFISEQQIIDLNPAAIALFGCADKQRMLGYSLSDWSPAQQADGAMSALRQQQVIEQAHATGNCRYEWRYVRDDDSPFWAEVLLTSVQPQRLVCAVIRDISNRKLAECSLYLAAQVFENAHEAILISDPQRRVMALNPAYTKITGYNGADMLGTIFGRQETALQGLSHHVWIELAAVDHWQGEIRGLHKHGHSYPAWLSLTVIRDSQGAVSNYMGILSDITELKKAEAHIRHLAEHDFLTDLPNRVLLLDRLSLAMAAARRNQNMVAVLFLDLDHFKNINDTLGHHVGDALLKEVAHRLIKCVRGVDTVSRQGGDEFIIILVDIGDIEQVAHVAASILQAVAQRYQIAPHELHISTSLGVSVFPSDGADMDTLIKNADIAMYHAKESGRNSYQFFNAEMNTQIIERVQFENGLRRALDENEFVLHYQPQINIGSGAMVGVEVLIRWHHPELGLLQPQRFIRLAEKIGLMIPLFDWALQQACEQGQRWHQAGYRLVIALNLSLAQLMHKNLFERVSLALATSGLPAHCLEFEISEASIIKGGASVIEVLGALRQLGLKLTVDDFGAGYSRLRQLKQYPINKLKIDQSFMADINDNHDDAAVLSAIIAMARSLKLQVIAEGVETAQQLAFLRGQGCDEYQGFYASPAVPAEALSKLLK